MRRFLIFIAGLLAGSGIGAGGYLLLAPVSGDDLRQRMRDRWQAVKENSQQAAADREAALREELAAMTSVQSSEPIE